VDLALSSAVGCLAAAARRCAARGGGATSARREGLPSWADRDSFLTVRSVQSVRAASSATGAQSHRLSLSGGSASFFKVMVVGGIFGGGRERGATGERLVRWTPTMVAVGLLPVFGCWFGRCGGGRRCSV
jgi:hypothetical protein